MFSTIQAELGNRLVLPENEQYEEKRKVWNGAFDHHPKAIITCETEQDIVAGVKFAADNDLSISVKGGGHHVGGFASCDDGVMIDLSQMRTVEVDEARQVAIVEAGALLQDVDRETQKYGLATPTGTISETGIAGLTLSGGLGYLRGKYGLTIDNLLEARVVTADGQLLEVNENTNQDLFWAIRGGGGNFGVVTKFTYKLHHVGPEVLAIDVIYDYQDAKQILINAQAYIEHAPDEVSFNLFTTQLPAAPFLPEFLHNKKVILIAGMYTGDPTAGEEAIQPLRELANPIVDQSGVIPYTVLQSKSDAMVENYIPVYGTSLYFDKLTETVIDALLKKLESVPSPGYMAQLWGLSGAMNRVPGDATAYAIRDASFVLLLDVMAVPGVDTTACERWVDALLAELLPYAHRQAGYLNGIGENEVIAKNTFASNYDRLADIKAQYDPNNLFRYNHNIAPAK